MIRPQFKLSGSGPCILLVPGLASTIDSWGYQIRGLNKHFKMLVIENSVMVSGNDSDGELGIARMLNDIEDVLKLLEIDKVSILGSSMGGIIGWEYANRHPEQVDSLILSSLPLKSDTHMDDCLSMLLNMVKKNDPVAFVSELIKNFFSNEFLLGRRFQFVKELFLESILRIRMEAIYNQLMFLKKWHDLAQYPGLPHKPCLLIYGTEDKVVNFSVKDGELQSLFPSAEIKFIDGAGHAVHIEKPSIFNEIVHKFLKPDFPIQNSIYQE